MDSNYEDDENVKDIREQIFDSTVRENIIFFLLFLLLYSGSFSLIGKFRRRDKEDLYSTDEDELLVYRICLWLCSFSLAIAIGAALLLPISIASNEILVLYPNSTYVTWLNSSLIHGLWNNVFLYANLSLFVLLPFTYLFAESAGFTGHRKGIISRVYETFTVLSLLAFIVLGLIYVISAVIDKDKRGFRMMLSLGSCHLPFLYSCVSFMGVMILLVCTPLGFVRLFGVVGNVLVKPHLLRDVNEEFYAFNLEEASVQRKQRNGHVGYQDDYVFHQRILNENVNPTSNLYYRNKNGNIQDKLNELKFEKKELNKLRSSSSFHRNFIYPLAMLLLLLLTGITVLIVIQNILELLVGIKALPTSTRQFTLGITSLSKLGPFGAALGIFLILYLGATSSVGLYTLPIMEHVRPKFKKCSLAQLIINCALLLIVSSALPLLSRILGITNFDLLGDFGAIEWLGNFTIVLLYNLFFGTATAMCLFSKFTVTVRRELFARLFENYFNFLSCIN